MAEDIGMETAESKLPAYNPTKKQKERIRFVYDERSEMITKRDQPYAQFNDRNLREFIDDSEKRLNAYVIDKAAQGKEDWQANFATRVYANKAKALLAATSRSLPDIRWKAVNEEDGEDYFCGDVMRRLVQHSYNQGNPQEDMFFLGWSNIAHGTVLSYEGYEKQTFSKKRIKAFDLMTGDVEEEETQKVSDGEPVSFEVQLMGLLIKNFYIRDIQEQPAIIWEGYYADKERFDASFKRYPNSKFVKDIVEMKPEEYDTFFHKHYQESALNGKGYVVSRYINKYKDIYRIIANGVELYNGSMPWVDVTRKHLGKKAYPIAKTIFEPFANTDFFYGNSQPNSAMGEGDVLNTFYNTAVDKEYRAMVPPLLIGQVNKDMLDLEDEIVAGDTKIYVDDINQVKQMELRGVSDSNIKMIDLISRNLDLTLLDPQQQGVPQKYITARAALAADERARQLKGVFFMFMESLWLQKVRLRAANILLSYTRPKLVKVIGEDGTVKLFEKFKRYDVGNSELSDGSKGTMSIRFADRKDMDIQQLQRGIEAEEEESVMAGKPMEAMILPYDKLENLSYSAEIIPETLWQSSQAINMAMAIEKIEITRTNFPEIFANNKEIFFKDLIKNYNDDPERYNIGELMGFEDEQGLELAGLLGGKQSPTGESRVASDINGVDQGNRLSNLVEQ
jgi:hypothetical protein